MSAKTLKSEVAAAAVATSGCGPEGVEVVEGAEDEQAFGRLEHLYAQLPAMEENGAALARARSAASAQEQDVPTALLSGRHYVVLGVFSTEENARRAVRETEAKESALRCRIYRFGGKFMVSPFSSDDAGACAQFIRVQDGRFPDMWPYTAR